MARLSILNPSEKRQFELPQKFNHDERISNFFLSSPLKRHVSRFCRNGRAGE